MIFLKIRPTDKCYKTSFVKVLLVCHFCQMKNFKKWVGRQHEFKQKYVMLNFTWLNTVKKTSLVKFLLVHYFGQKIPLNKLYKKTYTLLKIVFISHWQELLMLEDKFNFISVISYFPLWLDSSLKWNYKSTHFNFN